MTFYFLIVRKIEKSDTRSKKLIVFARIKALIPGFLRRES